MAVNFSALNTVYNHYLTSYAPKSSTSLDTHKKSELRSVYNSIIKLNKNAPLYIMDETKDYKSFAITLKENARSLSNTIASLSDANQGTLGKKVAYSTKEELATVNFIGSLPQGVEPPSIELEVNRMASPQVNFGNFIPSSKKANIEPATYSFDIEINKLNYEFQFHINESDTNLQIQERLSRLIQNADIGIATEVLHDDSGNSSLKLSSIRTGTEQGQETIFHISDHKTSKNSGTVEYLGIDHISRPASNAVFKINGNSFSTYSNHFTIEKMYEISLNGLSSFPDDVTTIGLKDNIESLTENVQTLLCSYNMFMKAAAEFNETQTESTRLIKELSYVASMFENEFTTLGLASDTNGILTLNTQQFQLSASTGNMADITSTVKNFSNTIKQKAIQVNLNPLEYADKKMAAYKNPRPGHNFANPYITSTYSGMLFNSYC